MNREGCPDFAEKITALNIWWNLSLLREDLSILGGVLQNINRIYFIFTFAGDFSFFLTSHLNNPQLRPDITAAFKNFRVQPEWYNPAASAKFFINENLTT